MNRRGFLLSSLMLSAVPAWAAPDERFARGLLWRVSKKGVAPSHVFGTIHVADPRLAELPPAVRRAFGGARSLMLEFMPDAYSNERFLEAALFLDRQTLEQKIGTEDFQLLSLRSAAGRTVCRSTSSCSSSRAPAAFRFFKSRRLRSRSSPSTNSRIWQRSGSCGKKQRELRRGAAFVALGALHLYGDKGVLALLEEDGYRATRVY